MSEKNTIKVMIDGKSVSIGGYESTEYLEHVAFYINNKINEMKEMPGYSRQSAEMKTILLALNVADDYYKAKNRADALEEDIEARDGEWYSVKQDLANAQARIHELEYALSSHSERSVPASVTQPRAAQMPENPEAYAAEVPDTESPAYTEQDAGVPEADGAETEADEPKHETDVAEHETDEPKHDKDEPEQHPARKLNDKYLKRSRRYAKNRG